ncbi:hypothetical protein L1D29_10950 [Shewanella insulae]|uniref:hypothetical protein n=1 Tax=Shewanella insulae TaxID=2681496 RepID=UPI001EFC9AEE|nr:hypothetical protein [Shewanella insulae]MCG9713328.1 hypothetical protein [Shewanella insulae]
MDYFIEKIYDPAFWFQGLFFPIILYLFSKLFKVTPIVVKWLGNKVINGFLRRRLKGLSRWFIKKELIKVKQLRRNPYAIQYQIAKEHSYFLIFIVTSFLYLALAFTTQIANLLAVNTFAFIITTAPLYCIEFKWLIENSLVKKLIISANKIGPSHVN